MGHGLWAHCSTQPPIFRASRRRPAIHFHPPGHHRIPDQRLHSACRRTILAVFWPALRLSACRTKLRLVTGLNNRRVPRGHSAQARWNERLPERRGGRLSQLYSYRSSCRCGPPPTACLNSETGYSVEIHPFGFCRKKSICLTVVNSLLTHLPGKNLVTVTRCVTNSYLGMHTSRSPPEIFEIYF